MTYSNCRAVMPVAYMHSSDDRQRDDAARAGHNVMGVDRGNDNVIVITKDAIFSKSYREVN